MAWSLTKKSKKKNFEQNYQKDLHLHRSITLQHQNPKLCTKHVPKKKNTDFLSTKFQPEKKLTKTKI